MFIPWLFLFMVAVAMPRRSRMSPMTRSLGKFCFSKSGLVELLLAVAIAASTCQQFHALSIDPRRSFYQDNLTASGRTASRHARQAHEQESLLTSFR